MLCTLWSRPAGGARGGAGHCGPRSIKNLEDIETFDRLFDLYFSLRPTAEKRTAKLDVHDHDHDQPTSMEFGEEAEGEAPDSEEHSHEENENTESAATSTRTRCVRRRISTARRTRCASPCSRRS